MIPHSTLISHGLFHTYQIATLLLSLQARRDASREESTEETGDGGLKHKKSAKADKKKKPSGKGGKGTKGKRSSDKGKKQEVRGGLSAKRMNKGMLVLACVRDVHDTHMLVSGLKSCFM